MSAIDKRCLTAKLRVDPPTHHLRLASALAGDNPAGLLCHVDENRGRSDSTKPFSSIDLFEAALSYLPTDGVQ